MSYEVRNAILCRLILSPLPSPLTLHGRYLLHSEKKDEERDCWGGKVVEDV